MVLTQVLHPLLEGEPVAYSHLFPKEYYPELPSLTPRERVERMDSLIAQKKLSWTQVLYSPTDPYLLSAWGCYLAAYRNYFLGPLLPSGGAPPEKVKLERVGATLEAAFSPAVLTYGYWLISVWERKTTPGEAGRSFLEEQEKLLATITSLAALGQEETTLILSHNREHGSRTLLLLLSRLSQEEFAFFVTHTARLSPYEAERALYLYFYFGREGLTYLLPSPPPTLVDEVEVWQEQGRLGKTSHPFTQWRQEQEALGREPAPQEEEAMLTSLTESYWPPPDASRLPSSRRPCFLHHCLREGGERGSLFLLNNDLLALPLLLPQEPFGSTSLAAVEVERVKRVLEVSLLEYLMHCCGLHEVLSFLLEVAGTSSGQLTLQQWKALLPSRAALFRKVHGEGLPFTWWGPLVEEGC